MVSMVFNQIVEIAVSGNRFTPHFLPFHGENGDNPLALRVHCRLPSGYLA